MTQNDLKRAIKATLVDSFPKAEEYQIEIALSKIMDSVSEAILQVKMEKV